MTTEQSPSGSKIEGLAFTQPVPLHWSSDEGTEMANTYAAMSRDDLAYRQDTDFALANAIFMVSRHELELMALQTAAKERIRWLSAHLAIANQKEQALIDRIEALEASLSRQCDNMAFVVNHVTLHGWHDKFRLELEADRTTLSGDTL